MSSSLQPLDYKPKILCVDDELEVLNSLKRLLRHHGDIILATSGAQALDILKEEVVDLLITDMRMPVMTGTDLLGHVNKMGLNPACILLTAYTDLNLLEGAINQGILNRYIHKPWNNQQLISAVRDELERKRLERDNHRLLKEVQQKNDALTDICLELELTVKSLNSQLLTVNLLGKEAQVTWWTFDQESRQLECSPNLGSYFGLSSDCETVSSFSQLGGQLCKEDQSRLNVFDAKLLSLLSVEVTTEQIARREIPKSFMGSKAETSALEVRITNDLSRWVKLVGVSYSIDGGSKKVYGCLIDLTDEVSALQKSELRSIELKSATEASNIHVFEEDLALNTGVFVTSPSLYPTGTGSPLLGRALYAAVPNAFHDEIRKCYAHEGYVAEFPIELPHLDNPFWVRQQVVRRFNRGKQAFAVVVAVDVSESHLANAKLKTSLQEAQTFVTELEAQRERQRQMFAIIGHELRTPAASLHMLLEDQGVRELQPHGALIYDTSEHLISVLDDLRSVVRPEGSDIGEIVSDTLTHLFDRALTPLKPLIEDSRLHLNISFSGDSDRLICGNFQALRQILTNLVKNAALYSGGENIWVSAHSRLIDSQHVSIRLKVEDDGRGISSDVQAEMFSAFTRGDSLKDGTGLGLFICKDLTQKMGGELSYSSRIGGGASFVINILFEASDESTTDPVSQPSALTQVSQPHGRLRVSVNGDEVSATATPTHRATLTSLNIPKQPLQQGQLADKSVLVAEDNPVIQMLTRRLLENLGAEVEVADNGLIALALIKARSFDLVISDIFMPELDGYGLCKAIRSLNLTLPIIGVTAATIGEEVDKMMAAGASQVIHKPINSSALLAALAKT